MQILSNGYNIFGKESHGCYISNVKLSIGRAREKNLFAIIEENTGGNILARLDKEESAFA